MGIGTLIIFIATILVAAVAAGVLISTSGVLQQRALLAGTEARKRITNSIEVISVLAEGNSTAESLNNYEMYVRLEAGSDPLQMRKLDIQIITETWDSAGTLQHESMDSSTEVFTTLNTTWTSVPDVDGDDTADYGRIVTDWNTSDDFIQFNMSSAGISRNISLGEDISNGSSNVEFELLDKIVYDSDYDGYIFVDVEGGPNSADEAVLNSTVNLTLKNYSSECSFAKLLPETKYCYNVMHGNDDTVLDSGERFKMLYRAKPGHELATNEEFRMIWSAEKGRLSEIRAYTPDVVVTRKVPLWPLN